MEQKHKSIAIFFLVFVCLSLWSRLCYLDNKNNELTDQISEYKDALNQANSNIEEAKWYAWESYEEMGNALDYLETVEAR